jgi:hypothetical protein
VHCRSRMMWLLFGQPVVPPNQIMIGANPSLLLANERFRDLSVTSRADVSLPVDSLCGSSKERTAGSGGNTLSVRGRDTRPNVPSLDRRASWAISLVVLGVSDLLGPLGVPYWRRSRICWHHQ